jgi:hypothetical protein
MNRFTTLGLALGFALITTVPASAIMPHRPVRPQPAPAFQDLSALESTSCEVLGKLMVHPDVLKHARALSRKGGRLNAIAPLSRARIDEQTLVVTYVSTSSPLDPNPPAPWSASFRVKLFLPQDAGWQIGSVSPLEVIGLPSAR